MTEEEIFIKEKPKKKRVLSEKQLAGLAKGRAKMAEKRRLKKEIEAKKKELADVNKKITTKDTEAVEQNKEEVKKVRKKKKEILTEQEEYLKKKKKGDISSSKFNKLKTGAIKHIKTSEEMDEFEKIMSGVTREMERNPEDLYRYLREHGDRLIGKTKKKLEPVKVVKEEKKPGVKLSIDEL